MTLSNKDRKNVLWHFGNGHTPAEIVGWTKYQYQDEEIEQIYQEWLAADPEPEPSAKRHWSDPDNPMSEPELATMMLACTACNAKPGQACEGTSVTNPHISRVDVLRSLRLYVLEAVDPDVWVKDD